MRIIIKYRTIKFNVDNCLKYISLSVKTFTLQYIFLGFKMNFSQNNTGSFLKRKIFYLFNEINETITFKVAILLGQIWFVIYFVVALKFRLLGLLDSKQEAVNWHCSICGDLPQPQSA